MSGWREKCVFFSPSRAMVGGRRINCPTILAHEFEPLLHVGLEALTTRALHLSRGERNPHGYHACYVNIITIRD